MPYNIHSITNTITLSKMYNSQMVLLESGIELFYYSNHPQNPPTKFGSFQTVEKEGKRQTMFIH